MAKKVKKQASKKKSSSKGGGGAKGIEKEIMQLGKDVDSGKLRGEAVEDAADVIKGKVKALAVEGKLTPEQAKSLKNKLEAFDD